MKLEALKDAARRFELVKAIGAELEAVKVTETDEATLVEWDGAVYYADDFAPEANLIVMKATDGDYDGSRDWRRELAIALHGLTVEELTA